MFPVMEHKALSTAWEIIGPECNTASKALKEIFSSLSSSLFFLNLLPFVSFILKLFVSAVPANFPRLHKAM